MFLKIKCLRCRVERNVHRSNTTGICGQCATRITCKIKSKTKRELVLEAYGNQCACCAERIKEFLCVDHINSNGKFEREQKKYSNIYSYLVENNFPKGNYRLLCYNCNIARHRNNGICPHKNKRDYMSDRTYKTKKQKSEISRKAMLKPFKNQDVQSSIISNTEQLSDLLKDINVTSKE